jgi:WD40 repeat protein
MYTDTNCVQLIKAHSSAVTALNYAVSTGLLASAGRDNYIRLFNISITPAQGNKIIRWYFIIFENFSYFLMR